MRIILRLLVSAAPLAAVLLVLWGSPPASADPINVAPQGTASQSTTGWSMPATLAIDGNLNNITHTAGTEVAPAVAWWEDDLGEPLPLERIVIHNRLSCCWERLCNIKVYVLDAARAVQWESDLLNPNNALGFAEGNVGGFDLDLVALTGAKVVGQIVRVERTRDVEALCDGYYLALAEVQIFVDSSDLPVEINAQPRGGRGYIGECFVFSVGLFNEQEATTVAFQWFKDDAVIDGATDRRLILADLQADDAGVYKVEVNVDGEVLTSDPAALVIAGLNLALYGTATQSTTDFGGVPERAIDGNTSGVWGDGSTSHTQDHNIVGGDCWWRVDLLGQSFIDAVVIWGRTDGCCVARLTDFRVMALDEEGDEVWGESFFPPPGLAYPDTTVNGFEVDLPDGTECHAIKIQRLGPDSGNLTYLSLAEVEVLGLGPVPPPDPHPNLARTCGALSRQSSQYSTFHSGLAVDGNYDNFTHTLNTDSDATWEIDLAYTYDLDLIVLYNRTSCCGSRLRDITVSILDAGGTIVWQSGLLNAENWLGAFPNGPAALSVDLTLLTGAPVAGQIVRVHRTADTDFSGGGDGSNPDEGVVLSLGEVEIYSTLPRVGQLAGDCNQDGALNIGDIVCGVKLLYAGFHLLDRTAQEPPCTTAEGNLAVLDVNGDMRLNGADIAYIAGYLFQGGPPPVLGTDCFPAIELHGCPDLCTP